MTRSKKPFPDQRALQPCPALGKFSSLSNMRILLFYGVSALAASFATCAPTDSQPMESIWSTERDTPHESQASPHSSTNLTYSPWPNHRYVLPLGKDFGVAVFNAEPYNRRPLPDIHLIQEFLDDFAANLDHAYPAPSHAPRRAGQSTYDMTSFTKMEISEVSIPAIGRPAPTEIVIAALQQMQREVGKHGPPRLLCMLVFEQPRSKEWLERVCNILTLRISPLGQGAVIGQMVDKSPNFTSTS